MSKNADRQHFDFTPRYENHHHRIYWAIIKVHIQCTHIYRYGFSNWNNILRSPSKTCPIFTFQIWFSDFILQFISINLSNCPVSLFLFVSMLMSIFHFHHVCVTDIFLRMLFISLVERIRFNYVTSLLWVTPIGPPPMLMRLVSWNRLQQRNKFMHALRKPRFMKQYVIGLQQLDE